jgi:hypothetical protein
VKTFIRVLTTASVATLLLTSTSQATGSIFSSLGLGVMENLSSSRAAGLGNAGLALEDSNTVNFGNPALLSTILRARIAVGGYTSRQWMQDPVASDKDDWAQVEYFGLALPVKKGWGVGFFLLPYSRIEYKYAWSGELVSKLPNISPAPYLETYQGTGGLTRAGLNLAWAPSAKVRLGLGGNVIWGSVQEYRTSLISAPGYGTVQFTTTRHFLGFGGTVGLLVRPASDLALAAAFEPHTPLRMDRTYTYTTGDSTTTSGQDFQLPARYSLGAAYQISPAWLTVAQVIYDDWSDLENLPGGSSTYRDAFDVGVGAEWTPGTWDSEGFFRRLQYRFGLRREATYLKSKGHGVDNYVFSTGIGYPFRQGLNRLDFSFEFGRRGDLAANDGREDTFRFRLGLNLGETWFQRTKPPWVK